MRTTTITTTTTLASPRRRQLLTLTAAAAGVVAAPGIVRAQSSDRPVRFVLPVSAGSGVDTIVRACAPTLALQLRRPVVVENQPGAGGITGTATLVKAAPDGFTLSVVSNNHVIFPSVYKSLPFDPIADITPITVLGSTPLAVVVNPHKLPVKTVPELVALLKANPGKYNYGSAGNGTILHLAAAMFLEEAGVTAQHVPYKGTGPLLADLLGGQVDMGVIAFPAIQAHLQSRGLVAVGVGTAARSPILPDLPTVAEQGLPGYVVEGWFGVIGPARLPAASVQQIHQAFVAAMAVPEVRDAMLKQGNAINPTSPEAAAAFFRAEKDKYARIVKAAGVQAA
ncbi:MAG: ABC transporter substrate-binding protein [Variovorax paradoxus]|nr:MAG: ABC transporter substrate-binding protein [Variovorax paradoxus]PZQ15124.1 MAG: ABC transporter substrate-binding protein [Variovorax paradoxus]HVR50029.1 tripartite tricarboxylate transporter substrate-binding protein [Pseudorhodoferax sp.]